MQRIHGVGWSRPKRASNGPLVGCRCSLLGGASHRVSCKDTFITAASSTAEPSVVHTLDLKDHSCSVLHTRLTRSAGIHVQTIVEAIAASLSRTALECTQVRSVATSAAGGSDLASAKPSHLETHARRAMSDAAQLALSDIRDHGAAGYVVTAHAPWRRDRPEVGVGADPLLYG